VRRCGAQGCVKRDVVGFAVGGARLHIAPALAVRARAAAPAAVLARKFV
jgi:hypothetical protein